MKKYTLVILATLLLLSCKDEYTICDLPTAVRMKCVFYRIDNGMAAETAVPFLIVRNISSPNADYALPMVSGFGLALNPVADSVQYQVSINSSSIPDTLTFVYNSQKTLISAVCGEVYINSLTRVNTTYNTLDSATISHSSVTTTLIENIRIYF